jgi:hypothetical protein
LILIIAPRVTFPGRFRSSPRSDLIRLARLGDTRRALVSEYHGGGGHLKGTFHDLAGE